MRYIKSLLISMAFILSACGGGGDSFVSDTSGFPPTAESFTGVLLDSPVSNVDYTNSAGTSAGVTNSSGEFEYLEGETVFFSIGDLEFPSVSAGAMITPMDMAYTLDTSNSKVTNIVRLLMTLDKDGNPANGITITDTAKAVATQVDITLSDADFASSGAVTNLIFNAGQDTVVPGLVSKDDAIAHFEAQLVANNIDFGTLSQQEGIVIQQYLTDNNLEAIKHPTGVYYNITLEGSGESPISNSTVTVRYTGRFLDGTIFDESNGSLGTQFSLLNVIAGWEIALPLLKSGGTGIFYIPSALAYGEAGSGTRIPANSILIFEIELISFLI